MTTGYSAIRTTYNGRVYRSRLESGVALTLDQLGIKFQHEPSSFLLDDGTHYMPDFWCPQIRLWIEVRGYATPKSERQIEVFGQAIMAGRLRPDKMMMAAPPPVQECAHDYDTNCNEICAPRWRGDNSVDYMVLSPGNVSKFFEEPSYHTCRGEDNGVNVCLCKCGQVYFCGESNDWRCRVCGDSDKQYHCKAVDTFCLDDMGQPAVLRAKYRVDWGAWEHTSLTIPEWLTQAKAKSE
jgi:hypothetical protein